MFTSSSPIGGEFASTSGLSNEEYEKLRQDGEGNRRLFTIEEEDRRPPRRRQRNRSLSIIEQGDIQLHQINHADFSPVTQIHPDDWKIAVFVGVALVAFFTGPYIWNKAKIVFVAVILKTPLLPIALVTLGVIFTHDTYKIYKNYFHPKLMLDLVDPFNERPMSSRAMTAGTFLFSPIMKAIQA